MPFPTSHPALDRALSERGYAEPTPVQARVLEAPDDRDLLVSAQTGSGKTVAFGLALAPTLLGLSEAFGPPGAPAALVIAPTRELALQVCGELTWLYAATGAKILSCVGGMDPRTERRALERGGHIVVGTPGRLRDHAERGALDLSALRAVVLDEADEMLDMGFQEDLTFLLDAAPSERRTLLFSATLPREIVRLAGAYQRDALRIDTVDREAPHGDIAYRAVRVLASQADLVVVNLLRFYEAPGALVFANTRERVKHLTATLRERGFSVVGLSGELTQDLRTEALQALRAGYARVCVATDVAARGLDLPDLGLVIHAEVPVNVESLLHRSGRTGRAGRKGVSVLLVPKARRRKAELLFQSASIRAEWSGPPTADEIREKDRQRMLEDPLLVSPPDEDCLEAGRLLLERLPPEQVAGALMRLYREKLPPPEDVQDDGPPGAGRSLAEREPRPRREPGESEWFRIDIGRRDRADPKWLIPKICRAGGITKREIGFIRILDAETRFEIAREAAPAFAAAIAAPLPDGTRITPSEAPGAEDRPPRPARPRREFEPLDDGASAPVRAKRAPRPVVRDEPASGPPRNVEKKPYPKALFPRKPGPPGDRGAGATGDRPWKGKPRTIAGDAPARAPGKRRPNDGAPPRGGPYRGKPKRSG
ncbi:MAG: DEAD/DEAH box helicase [Phenylobacterium sp.]